VVSLFPLSAQAVMLFAVVSAFCRAGLNLIDRHQIGLQGLSIATVNFWNNAVPAAIMVMGLVALGWQAELAACVLDWRTALFSGLVQGVAYAFSYAFRHLNVSQVMVAGKASDLLIPVGIFLVVGHWDGATYAFAAATTLVCLPLLRGDGRGRTPGAMRRAAALIGGALVLQASLAPLLAASGGATADVRHVLVFAAAVIVWRTAWSLPALLRRRIGAPMSSRALLGSRAFMARVLLSVATQITFVMAVGSAASALAWPILNSTGILAMVFSSLLLRERPSAPEAWAVTAITAMALLRFVSL
jgi:uncharacterized membrane protein